MHLQKKLQLQRLVMFATMLVSNVGALMLHGLTPADAAPEAAKVSDTFVNSIGINTHLPYKDTPYANYAGLVKPRLQELGIRHIRDNAYDHGDATHYAKLKDLSAIGIKSNLFFHGQQPVEVVAISKALKGTIEAVEGPNETDLTWLSPLTYKGQVFPQVTRTYQNDIYAAIKNDPLTKYLPVVMPSMGWGENAALLGPLNSGDIGNMHSYPKNAEPPTPTIDIFPYFIFHARKITSSPKPLWSTETGYTTLLSDPQGVSESVQAKYLTRLLLEYFNLDIKRVYLYQLIDPRPGLINIYDHTGLIRNNGTLKPAYTAIKNLIYLLKEPGTTLTPGSLDYTLSGDITNVHHTLLQKSTGSGLPPRFFLVLWQEVPSWNNQTKQDIAVPNRNLTLTLTTPIRQVATYQPLSSVNPVTNVTGPSGAPLKQLPISVPDHPLVIRLVP